MSTRRVQAGSTDVSITLKIVDSTDGTPETGVVFNSAGIDLWYRRELAAAVDITEATLAALTTAHADGGFLHISDGVYRLDLPDAACAAGVPGVQIGGIVTGMVVLAPYIELPVNTEAEVYARIGAPAGASIAADIAVIEAQTDDIGTAGAGLTALATQASVDTIDNFLDTEIAAITAAVITNAAGVDIAADIIAMRTVVDAIESQTDDIGVAGAGLTAVAWNAAWDAEVESEVLDALDIDITATPTAGSVNDVLSDLDARLPAAGTLSVLTAAAVNAEVVDALATDTYAEPGQGTPAATATLAAKIGYLYKAWRNRHTQTATEYALYADDATTKDQEAVVSDDATTFERGEISTGV